LDSDWAIISCDDFEDKTLGTFTDGGDGVSITSRSPWLLARSGNNYLDIHRGTDDLNSSVFQTNFMNVTEFAEVQIVFDYKVASFDNIEYWTIEIDFNDEQGWNVLQAYVIGVNFVNSRNGSHDDEKQARVAASTTGKSEAKFRIVNKGTGHGDFVFIDNIVVASKISA
jgi:hypothetical protein